jgi:hypothetical protein
MPRKAEKYPPYLSADKAFDAIDKIYKRFGKMVNIDLLSDILQTSRTSSNFRKRVYALQTFGLATVEKDKLTLTPLALKIVAPVTQEEKGEALAEAIERIEILKQLRARYVGGHLPESIHLRNLLVREYDVPEGNAELWLKFVVDSLEVFQGPAINRGGEREQPGREIIDEIYDQHEKEIKRENDDKKREDTISIQLKKGSNRAIVIPHDLNRDELVWFNKWFDVWEERPE